MGKKDGFWKATRDGFEQILLLDNMNIYSTITFEAWVNIVKDGMWNKLMNVYCLVVSGGDKGIVGSIITTNGFTRASVGVVAGGVLIDRLGADAVLKISGVFGLIGLAMNGVTFGVEEGSVIWMLFALNFVWAVFTGLSNSALETIYAKSIVRESREDINTARQMLNKFTTAMGPLISIAFLFMLHGSDSDKQSSMTDRSESMHPMDMMNANGTAVMNPNDMSYATYNTSMLHTNGTATHQRTSSDSHGKDDEVAKKSGWSIDNLTPIMLASTVLTLFPIVCCFTFDTRFEVRQVINLSEIHKIVFLDPEILPVENAEVGPNALVEKRKTKKLADKRKTVAVAEGKTMPNIGATTSAPGNPNAGSILDSIKSASTGASVDVSSRESRGPRKMADPPLFTANQGIGSMLKGPVNVLLSGARSATSFSTSPKSRTSNNGKSIGEGVASTGGNVVSTDPRNNSTMSGVSYGAGGRQFGPAGMHTAGMKNARGGMNCVGQAELLENFKRDMQTLCIAYMQRIQMQQSEEQMDPFMINMMMEEQGNANQSIAPGLTGGNFTNDNMSHPMANFTVCGGYGANFGHQSFGPRAPLLPQGYTPRSPQKSNATDMPVTNSDFYSMTDFYGLTDSSHPFNELPNDNSNVALFDEVVYGGANSTILQAAVTGSTGFGDNARFEDGDLSGPGGMMRASGKLKSKMPTGIKVGKFCHKVTLFPEELTKYSFVQSSESRFARITYPIWPSSRFAELTVLKRSTLEDTEYILGKSYAATLNLTDVLRDSPEETLAIMTRFYDLYNNMGDIGSPRRGPADAPSTIASPAAGGSSLNCSSANGSGSADGGVSGAASSVGDPHLLSPGTLDRVNSGSKSGIYNTTSSSIRRDLMIKIPEVDPLVKVVLKDKSAATLRVTLSKLSVFLLNDWNKSVDLNSSKIICFLCPDMDGSKFLSKNQNQSQSNSTLGNLVSLRLLFIAIYRMKNAASSAARTSQDFVKRMSGLSVPEENSLRQVSNSISKEPATPVKVDANGNRVAPAGTPEAVGSSGLSTAHGVLKKTSSAESKKSDENLSQSRRDGSGSRHASSLTEAIEDRKQQDNKQRQQLKKKKQILREYLEKQRVTNDATTERRALHKAGIYYEKDDENEASNAEWYKSGEEGGVVTKKKLKNSGHPSSTSLLNMNNNGTHVTVSADRSSARLAPHTGDTFKETPRALQSVEQNGQSGLQGETDNINSPPLLVCDPPAVDQFQNLPEFNQQDSQIGVHHQEEDAIRGKVSKLLKVRSKGPGKNSGGGKKKRGMTGSQPNIYGANVIVTCDVLNALGNGMSLKFMDLFLVEEYEFSPIDILLMAFVTNLAAVFLAPGAKSVITKTREAGYPGKIGVLLLWSVGCGFLSVLCFPKDWDIPWQAIAFAIIMRNSLNGSAKGYLRAKLTNFLPHDKVANYMVWDSLNKAHQGGIVIFGAQLIQIGGYRACFCCTLVIMILRLIIFGHFTIQSSLQDSSNTDKVLDSAPMDACRKEKANSLFGKFTDWLPSFMKPATSDPMTNLEAKPANMEVVVHSSGALSDAKKNDLVTPLLSAGALSGAMSASVMMADTPAIDTHGRETMVGRVSTPDDYGGGVNLQTPDPYNRDARSLKDISPEKSPTKTDDASLLKAIKEDEADDDERSVGGYSSGEEVLMEDEDPLPDEDTYGLFPDRWHQQQTNIQTGTIPSYTQQELFLREEVP